MRYSMFVCSDHYGPDGTLTVTAYGSIDQLVPEKYAKFVHQWVWRNIKRPNENSWGVQVSCQDAEWISPDRTRHLTYIRYDHAAQKFTFESGHWFGFHNPPIMLPGISEFDWTCLLREEFS